MKACHYLLSITIGNVSKLSAWSEITKKMVAILGGRILDLIYQYLAGGPYTSYLMILHCSLIFMFIKWEHWARQFHMGFSGWECDDPMTWNGTKLHICIVCFEETCVRGWENPWLQSRLRYALEACMASRSEVGGRRRYGQRQDFVRCAEFWGYTCSLQAMGTHEVFEQEYLMIQAWT